MENLEALADEPTCDWIDDDYSVNKTTQYIYSSETVYLYVQGCIIQISKTSYRCANLDSHSCSAGSLTTYWMIC